MARNVKSAAPEADKFTEKERMFIFGIVSGSGKRDAAIAAGVSPKTAHVQASRMYNNPKIKAEIERLTRPKKLKNELLIAENADRAILEKYDVLKFLSEVVKDGGAKHVQIKAAELLLKQYGIKTDDGEESERTVERLLEAIQGTK